MEDFDVFKLDGRTLRVFVSVCETKSLSRTAEQFYLNQSTISHHIEKMRGAINDPLFVKAGRGIVPTEKAVALLPRVQWILSELEGLVAPEQYVASVESRPFVIGIATPAVIEDMRFLYQRLRSVSRTAALQILNLSPLTRLFDMLAEDEADIAITVAGMRYPSTLNTEPYGLDEMTVFYDPTVRGPITDVEGYYQANHAVVNFGGGVRNVVEEAFHKLGRTRNIALVAPTMSTLGNLVQGTDLIATLPRRLANVGACHGLATCPPPVEIAPMRYDLVWHRRYENSGRNIWLREMVKDVGMDIYPPRA